MFERYTEKARRAIFFARYEASQYGSAYIEAEHLLLGIVRETRHPLGRIELSETIRKRLEADMVIRPATSTSIDLPLSNECKRALGYAAEEAERLSHKHIGTEHLLLGILREDRSHAASVLRDEGIDLAATRKYMEQFARSPGGLEGNTVFTRSTPRVDIEFVSHDRIIASVQTGSRELPRAGDRVLLKDAQGKGESYRVEHLTYVYESAESNEQIPHRQLAKVLIELKPE
jgi:ATP-dependent Clp protease ATP-binding subunit ClpA